MASPMRLVNENRAGKLESPSALQGGFRVFLHGFADVPYHWHREMEIIFVLKGACRLVVDGTVCELASGDVMIINADVPHNSSSMSHDATICGVHLDLGHFERMGLPGLSERVFRCRTFLHGPSFMARVAPMKALIARLILDQANSPEEEMAHHIAAQLLATYIFRFMPYDLPDAMEAALNTNSQKRIAAILESLGDRPDILQLGMIAHDQDLTLSHLSRLFKKHLGVGYREYSIGLRLDRAAQDLRLSKESITAIMERYGFGNSAMFYRKFKERFGKSPAEYRIAAPAAAHFPAATADAATQELLLSLAGQVGAAAQAAIGFHKLRRVSVRAPHAAN